MGTRVSIHRSSTEPLRGDIPSSIAETITTFGVSSLEGKAIPHMPLGTDPDMRFSDALDTMKAHGTGVTGKMETGTTKAWIPTKALQTTSQA